MITAPIAPTRSGHLVIGIDTHKHLHVAAALDTIAGVQDTLTIANETAGFARLLEWIEPLGQVVAFGVEGTGSYGQTLTRFLRRKGFRVIEVNRPDRRLRRLNGKSDSLDAENAARAVLAGFATATPKSADGTAEAIRRLKVAYDTAIKARTAAMITLKTALIHADDQLRHECAPRNPKALTAKLARLRPKAPLDPETALRHTLRSLARRWIALDTEAAELAAHLQTLTKQTAPQLLEQFGIGYDTAAEILIAVGDNPERIRSEAALAKLAGACPIPAGSGKTDGRHRLNRGGNRQLNAALYRTIIVRMRFHEPTRDYVARRTSQGKSKKEIIRCLKRYLVREIFHLINPVTQTTSTPA